MTQRSSDLRGQRRRRPMTDEEMHMILLERISSDLRDVKTILIIAMVIWLSSAAILMVVLA